MASIRERAAYALQFIKCLLDHHAPAPLNCITGEFVRPAVWIGRCPVCRELVRYVVEEPPMIPESERIQLQQGDVFNVE